MNKNELHRVKKILLTQKLKKIYYAKSFGNIFTTTYILIGTTLIR